MFGIGMGEFILILIVGLIIFGPKNLPEVGKALGKGLREFRKAQAALSATLEESVNEPVKKSESVKFSTDDAFKTTKESPNSENTTAEISLDKKSEARITVDDVINTAKQNSVPKELYTGTANTSENETVEKISLDKSKVANKITKKSEPARITVDDVINTAKQNSVPKELYTGTADASENNIPLNESEIAKEFSKEKSA